MKRIETWIGLGLLSFGLVIAFRAIQHDHMVSAVVSVGFLVSSGLFIITASKNN